MSTTIGADTTFNYTGTIVHVTIGTSGTYDIAADGAQGGAGSQAAGGLGAEVAGDIYLAQGTQLEIVVGGVGGSGIFGGGGGGSFVIDQTTGIVLEVAGGGGGAGDLLAGGGAVTTTTGGAGGSVFGGAGGGYDMGGHAGGGSFGGGGGGGFTGGAGSDSSSTGAGGGTVAGTTFSGGAGDYYGGSGGFGGGGGGGYGGGGGGGYGGGGGGGTGFSGLVYADGGGGGGTWFEGAATTNLGGVHSGNGQITIDLVCFTSGTRILTARGEVAVEDLSVGDLAVTASGEARPVRWIGHRKIDRPSRAQWPVRVMAGAFGEGLPGRDLFLSAGHAVCVSVMDEVFVPVGQLINGAAIAQVEVPEVTYWHVELESHDVLLAEGLPTESYMDASNRAFFGREYGRLQAVDPERVAESLTRYARPFVDDGPAVEAIRARLAARAVTLGELGASAAA